jgi:hypothetical protein
VNRVVPAAAEAAGESDSGNHIHGGEAGQTWEADGVEDIRRRKNMAKINLAGYFRPYEFFSEICSETEISEQL